MKRARFMKDMLFFCIGSFLYASAVTVFISGNEISPGGFTGIATALNHLTGIPSGITLFLLNIPVLILGLIKFGGIFIIKTAVVTVITSVCLTVTDIFLPVFQIDKILAAVFGGMFVGLGISLIMLRGGTSGGVDIIAKLINKKHRHLTVGRLILIMDAFVIMFAVAVYGNIESALYSVVAMFVSSRVMDTLLYGADKGKTLFIVTQKGSEICSQIGTKLRRGVTVIKAQGGYSRREQELLICTVRRHEVSAAYAVIEEIDPKAFITVNDAGEIIGEGFKAFE